MPKRTDIHRILIIGSGPIVIGQACEFDYSGTQAVKALRDEGYEVVLVNSNPATIMTDPELADRTYIEPQTAEMLEAVIQRERPAALLPTVGGQTGLNLAVELAERGILATYGVELIGAGLDAMRLAEDRQRFKDVMLEIGLDVPRSDIAASVEEALGLADHLGYPVIIRPSFTLGGAGSGVAHDERQLHDIVVRGLKESPVNRVLIEESVIGWKEFELEVMRDGADNFVVVCSIENLDPMGVHTGDSITVAPAITLTDKEYQRMRDWARRVIRRVGVETGGSNIQFAVDPTTGRLVVIEMNPRVSRSSALASKATGFPIAKIAAKLAVGYTLDEIPNDITRETPASFEPVIDYVVVKIPRWDFAKFPGVPATLDTQMRSVGEVMAIGRTFKEALQKGLRSLEIGVFGLERGRGGIQGNSGELGRTRENSGELRELREGLRVANPKRIFAIGDALRAGMSVEEIHELTGIDRWFLWQMEEIIELERELCGHRLETLPADLLRQAKRFGFSDEQLGRLWGCAEGEVRTRRHALGIRPVYHRVDTCAAEFEAYTPYLYSTYETQDEANPTSRPKIIILGGGPNRIGQGIEFDYCCCHAAFALAEMGYETIMVNCNPETVSTDYDTSDRLYFEPLTLEDVLNIVDEEGRSRGETRRSRGEARQRAVSLANETSLRLASSLRGVIVQFGGQTPLKLAQDLATAGIPILGTSPDAIDLAEDRERFGDLLDELGIPQPARGTARSPAGAQEVAARIGYPLLVRPSYVLGGRAMAVVYGEDELDRYMAEAVRASPEHPVLIDRFVEDAFEVDVDAVADGERVVIGGVMQHIEEAGVHSGDSACVLPPYKISLYHLSIIREYTDALGKALGVIGLMNVQYAIKDDVVYVLEVNPRASRTVPFVSKATGVPLAKIGAQVMAGRSLEEIGFTEEPKVDRFCVKEAVLPFSKFPGVDARLGPEMRSTGEVMGRALRFGQAFAKAQIAAGDRLPLSGTVLITVNDFDKSTVLKITRDLERMGFRLIATRGTARFIRRVGMAVEAINKVSEGSPHVVDAIRAGQIDLIINTPLGTTSHSDGLAIRLAAIQSGIPLITTMSAARAAVNGIQALKEDALTVQSLQDIQ
ncbi:MAG: carbamoyl-phosphate synthase large subunit [Anaerolineae bacterium]